MPLDISESGGDNAVDGGSRRLNDAESHGVLSGCVRRLLPTKNPLSRRHFSRKRSIRIGADPRDEGAIRIIDHHVTTDEPR